MKKFLLFTMMILLSLPWLTKAQNCVSPVNLQATLHSPSWYNVTLNWAMESDESTDVLQWCTNDMYSAVGMSEGPVVFSAAVRFPVTSLSSYMDHSLVSVSFYPYTGGSNAAADYTINIYQGGSFVNGTFNPGNVVYTQAIQSSTLTYDAYNTVMLETPVAIDPTQELWITILASSASTQACYPFGCSNNGPSAGLGALLVEEDEWDDLTTMSGLEEYNWIIAGNVISTENLTSGNILSGYNVYRDNEQLNSTLLTGTSYVDTIEAGDYNYEVTAVYVNGCESAPVSVSVTMEANPCLSCLDSVVFGNNSTSTSGYIPTNPYYGYSYTQQIYDAATFGEINGGIQCVGINYIYPSAITRNLKIYMGNTSKNSFGSSTDWVPLSDMFLVYEGPVTFDPSSAVNGYVNIPLNTPFEWDGSSNVVFMVLDETGTYISSGEYFGTHSASSKSIYVYRDGTPYDNVLASATGSVYSYRNNIRFYVGEEIVCPMPNNFAVSHVTDQSAELSWTDRGFANDFELVLVPETSTFDDESQSPIIVSGTDYELTDLMPNTEYTVYLRSNCSSDNSHWVSRNFHTECGIVTELPYVEDFDAYANNVMPDCWHRLSDYDYPYTSSSYHASGVKSLYFYAYSPTYSMANTPMMDLSTYTPGSLVLSFKVMKTSDDYGRIEVGYMTDANDVSTFSLLKSIYSTDYPSTNIWIDQTVVLPDAAYAEPINIAFRVSSGESYVTNIVYLDDVTVDLVPECSNPSVLTVSHIEGSSAIVSWTAAPYGVTDYILEYSEAGQENWNIVNVSNATTYFLSELLENTPYEVRVSSDCAGEETTPITTTFITNCLSGGDYEVGNGTGSKYQIPVNNYYNYSYTQQIFEANEMNGPSDIRSVAFFYNYSTASTSKNNVNIYLGHTSKSAFSASSDYETADSLHLVYSGALNCQNGWNTFAFDSVFHYNGTDNLILAVDDNSGNYNGSSYTFRTHTTSSTKTIYYYSDSSNPTPSNPSVASASVVSDRNDVKFGGECDPMVACVKPNALITEYDYESITLTWVPAASESSWEIEYQLDGDDTWESEGVVTSYPYTISGLQSNSPYHIRIRSICDASDASDWKNLDCSTECAVLETLPIVEDFENVTGDFMDCWKRLTNYSSASPYITEGYNHTPNGEKALRFYCPGSSYYAYAVTPRFDENIFMNNLLIQFYAYKQNDGYMMEVGVMTNPDDPSTFITLGTFSPENQNRWELEEVTTVNYMGNGHYVAFRIPAWYSNDMYVDDIRIDVIPNCQHVADLHVNPATISTETVDIEWTPVGTEDAWDYVVSDTMVNPDDESFNTVSSSFVTIDGLAANTEYYVYVRANCGGEVSEWMYTNFKTSCYALTSADLPYIENFDSYTGSTSTLPLEGNLPDCWNNYFGGTASGYEVYPFIYDASSAAASGNNALRYYLYSGSTYGDEVAILPEIDTLELPMSSLMLSFDARQVNAGTSYMSELVVGVVTGLDMSSFQPVQTISIPAASYTTFDVYFANFTGSGNRIAIKMTPPTGNYYYNQCYVDNVSIRIASSCLRPTDIHQVSTTSNSIELGWTSMGEEESWNIEYGPTGFVLGEGTAVTATTNPYMISNLEDSVYDFYVSADCGSEQSMWTGPFSARPGTYFMPVSGTATISLCGGHLYDDGGPNNPYSNSSNAVLTIMPSAPGAVVSLSGSVYTESSFDELYIYDGASVTGAQLAYLTGNVNNVSVTSISGPLTLKFTSDGSLNYDGFDFAVSCVTCLAPADLQVSSVTTSQINFSWSGANVSGWEIEYGPAGFTQGSGTSVTTSSPSYSFTGLTPSTNYDFYFRTNCGGGDYSEWMLMTVATACDAMPVPYTEDFDSYAGTTYDQEGPVPTCWSSFTTSSTYEAPHVTSSSTGCYPHSGTNALTFVSNNGSSAYAVLPMFDQPLNTLKLRFWYEFESASSGTLTVGYVTSSANLSTFVPVATINGVSSLTKDSVDFSTAGNVPATGNIVFCWYKESTWYTCGIDDIEVVLAGSGPGPVDPDCPAPTALTVSNVTSTSVALDWTQADDVNGWIIYYKKASASSWTTISMNAHPTTITDLEVGTTYQAYVKALCDEGESEASNTVTFTTEPDGVNDYVLENSISLYPNPANKQLTISCADGVMNEVVIYDVYGKTLRTMSVNDNTAVLNVSDFAAGMYFVRIVTNDGMATKTFVKK